MSVSQVKAQYRSKYLVKVQNCLLLSKYWSIKEVKKLRQDFTYSELNTGKLIKVK